MSFMDENESKSAVVVSDSRDTLELGLQSGGESISVSVIAFGALD